MSTSFCKFKYEGLDLISSLFRQSDVVFSFDLKSVYHHVDTFMRIHSLTLVELKLLQDVVPILASILLKLPYDVEIPSDICSLITEMCNLALAPISRPSFPPPTPENKLLFFPNLLKIRVTHCCSAYQCSKGLEDIDACRKYSSNHPTLTPGIFTIYCLHGVCCGFEVMEQHESPRYPFKIFLSRFVTPPTIIYDNSCRLHPKP